MKTVFAILCMVAVDFATAASDLTDAGAASWGLRATVGAPQKLVRGDTAQIVVRFSAAPGRLPPPLRAASSAETRGLRQISLSTRQEVAAKGAELEFHYTVAAEDTGTLSLAPLRFEVPTDTGPAPILVTVPTIQVRNPVSPGLVAAVLAAIVALVAAIVAIVRMRHRKSADRQKKDTFHRDLAALRQEMETLRSRIGVAEAGPWLLDLERVCISSHRLRGLSGEPQGEAWKRLHAEFERARWGGANADALRLRELYRVAVAWMDLDKEDGEIPGEDTK